MAVVLLRHAWAGDRSDWEGDDRARPLDERGRAQAQQLAGELHALGVRRAVSSSYVRCIETVEPLGLVVELDDRLAEGSSGQEALALLGALADAVACTHGDVIERVLGRSLKKGEYVVV